MGDTCEMIDGRPEWYQARHFDSIGDLLAH
jgi:hypothetical protein